MGLEPLRAIVPIMRSAKDRSKVELLGTGFFVSAQEGHHIVTAKHVIEDNPLGPDELYSVFFPGVPGDATQVAQLQISRVVASRSYDVAACWIAPTEHLANAVALPLASEEPALNDDVLCFEYSGTHIQRKAQGGIHVSLDPHAHKGNIVRSYRSDFPESVPTPSYLTSFPALQGASGAPMLVRNKRKDRFAVVGLMVANAARHLMPAQILRIDHGESEQEEVRYYLPFGKALAREVLRSELDAMGVPFDSTD